MGKRHSVWRRGAAVVTGVAVAAVTVATLALPSAADTVIDSDGFEAVPTASPQTQHSAPAFLSPGGWQVTAGTVDSVPADTWADAEGLRVSLDLNGTSLGTLCKTFALVDGTYRLDFQMSHNGMDGWIDTGTADVTLNGNALGSFTHGPADGVWSRTDPQWSPRTTGEFAASGSTTLCFVSTTQDHAHGAAIDAVVLTQVVVAPPVNQPPSANIRRPLDGDLYYVGQQVNYDFDCTDPNGPADIAFCNASALIVPQGEEPDFDEIFTPVDGDPIETSFPNTGFMELQTEDLAGEEDFQFNTWGVFPTTGSCWAFAAQVLTGRFAWANPPYTPCVNQEVDVIDQTILLGTPFPFPFNVLTAGAVLHAVKSNTLSFPGAVFAHTEVAHARIGIPLLSLLIEIRGIESSASAVLNDGCNSPASLDGESEVAEIRINGNLQEVIDDEVNVLGLGLLRLNRQTIDSNGLTQVAVSLDLPGSDFDVKLGEARVNKVCNPFELAELPEEDDGGGQEGPT